MTSSFVVNSNPEIIALALGSLLRKEQLPPVILCIGSDRLTGDCLGPLAGHLMVDKYNTPAYVYGTLARPVTARNLVETTSFIRHRHPLNKLIAIDAALGRNCDIGIIKVARGGLEPGSALGRNLPVVGDFSVTAIVASIGTASQILMQETRLHLVYGLAEAIACGVSGALEHHSRALRSC